MLGELGSEITFAQAHLHCLVLTCEIGIKVAFNCSFGDLVSPNFRHLLHLYFGKFQPFNPSRVLFQTTAPDVWNLFTGAMEAMDIFRCKAVLMKVINWSMKLNHCKIQSSYFTCVWSSSMPMNDEGCLYLSDTRSHGPLKRCRSHLKDISKKYLI